MNTNSIFSLQRFSLVFKRYMVYNQKPLAIAFAAAGGLLIMLSLLITYSNQGVFTTNLFGTTGIVLVFITGYVVTSGIFKELHTPARGQFFLTLPASGLEKLASAWVISAPLFILIAYVGLSLFSFLAALLNAMIFKSAVLVFNPFTPFFLKIAGIYLVTQTIFFLGAVYFRKHNFLKTLLALWVIQTAIGLILGGVLYLLFGTTTINMTDGAEMVFPTGFMEWVPLIAKIIFWGLLGPFFLVVSYFRFKEREV